MKRWSLVVVSAGLALACGGVSVDTRSHLETVCQQTGGLAGDLDLVQVDLPVVPIGDGTPVRIEGGTTWVGWTSLTTAEELRSSLASEIDVQRQYRGKVDPLQVTVPPATSAELVRDVLQAAHAAGATDVHFVVASKEAVERLDYPDPAYAEELKQRLAGLDPSSRATEMAAEIEGLVAMCPGAQEVFAAIAAADPSMKCELIAVGMGEALPMCPLTNGDGVVTAIQVISEPSGDWRPTIIRVQPAPDGAAVAVTSGETFADLAPRLAAHDGKRVWIP